VVSPSNTAAEMEAKAAIYFRHGAREVWRVYPKTRHVVVHVGENARVESDAVTTPLLPGFALDIAEILGPI
jgi:Uma2 family endonuclease